MQVTAPICLLGTHFTGHRNEIWQQIACILVFLVPSLPSWKSFPSGFSQCLSTATNQKTMHRTTQFSTEWECSTIICVLSIKIRDQLFAWDAWEGAHVHQVSQLRQNVYWWTTQNVPQRFFLLYMYRNTSFILKYIFNEISNMNQKNRTPMS